MGEKKLWLEKNLIVDSRHKVGKREKCTQDTFEKKEEEKKNFCNQTEGIKTFISLSLSSLSFSFSLSFSLFSLSLFR